MVDNEAENEAADWETEAAEHDAAGWEAGAAGPGSGKLPPLEPGRLLPPAVGRLLLPPGDAAPLRGSGVAAALLPGPPSPGSSLPVGPSSGGARPTRLFRGTVTRTSTWTFLGRGRWPVPEGVHHGLADPTRELKAPRSPSRGTPSGSNRAGAAGPEPLASAWALP